ncbi:uncharacterized protein PFL1_04837 [Pseudozyma flocculosa PF-1]|uniref:HhH-GPD domain-containing protein n=1 Tax=Pseudozyma flocculosa PF-1 TaxID=1277687 RepID=A0A061H5H4_9BASI|nr:uncharacterized protein PFL1_04837 [Pseudozyma flocculosa PF-1]EPQ27699.1 hypothetical protein PFL1_04837 [Pseudozyma flocculosa PF-1]
MVTTRSRSRASAAAAPVVASPHIAPKRQAPARRVGTRQQRRPGQRSPYFADRAERGDDQDALAPVTKRPPRKRRRKAVSSDTAAATTAAGDDTAAEETGQPQSKPRTVHGMERSANFYGLIQELVSPNVFWLLVATCLLNQTRGRAAIPVFWHLVARWPDEGALADAPLDELTALLQPLGLHNIRARRLIDMSKKMVEVPHDPRNRFKARARECPETPIGIYPGGLGGERPVAPAELRLREQLDRQLRLDEPPTTRDAAVSMGQVAHTAHQLATVAGHTAKHEQAGQDAHATVVEAESESHIPEWKKVLPLDKELRAYLVWRWAKEGIEWHPERGPVSVPHKA